MDILRRIKKETEKFRAYLVYKMLFQEGRKEGKAEGRKGKKERRKKEANT